MSAPYYRVGQYYVDTSNPSAPVLWRCTGAGDKTSSTWAQVSGGGNNGATLFAITSLSNSDSFQAKPITVTFPSGTLHAVLGSAIIIAKLNRMRPSVASENFDGVTISYSSYTTDNFRIATDPSSNQEYQCVYPRYITQYGLFANNTAVFDSGAAYTFLTSQCVIKAIQILNGGSPYSTTSGAVWEEITPRVWARQYNQSAMGS